MTVHGLTQRMTAMAAREAALGAGARRRVPDRRPAARRTTSRASTRRDPTSSCSPAGSRAATATRCSSTPSVSRELAGAAHRRLRRQLGGRAARRRSCSRRPASGCRLTDNVYPAIDELDIVPARARHPRRLRGAHHARAGHGAHRRARERHASCRRRARCSSPPSGSPRTLGDLVVIDVGGATTDVHSITDGSPEIAAHADRAAAAQQAHRRGRPRHLRERARTSSSCCRRRSGRRTLPPALPHDATRRSRRRCTLAHVAAVTGVQRHAGAARAPLHADRPPDGRPRPRPDRLPAASSAPAARSRACPAARRCSRDARATSGGGERLLPPADARCALDRDYIFACCGALLAHFAPDAVVALMRASAGV